MKVELLADFHDLCGESPLWDYRTSELHWVDITGGRTHTFDQRSGSMQSFAAPAPASALVLANDANLIAAGSDGIFLIDRERRARQLVSNQPGPVNDAICDPGGRLLAGSTFWDGSDAGFPLGSLSLIDVDGGMRVLDDGFGLANGMGFSPDGQTLYFTDSLARAIYAYDYDPEAGSARNRRTLVRLSSSEGLPDGLTVDAQGFIWSAEWFGSCVSRYDPDGRLERRIAIPAQQVSSLAFGGPDFGTIFITTARQPDALAFAPPGYKPDPNGSGGQLFRCECGTQGKPEYVCRVSPKSDQLKQRDREALL